MEGFECRINGRALGVALQHIVRRASTNSGRFRVGRSRCWQRPSRFRRKCGYSCYTDYVRVLNFEIHNVLHLNFSFEVWVAAPRRYTLERWCFASELVVRSLSCSPALVHTKTLMDVNLRVNWNSICWSEVRILQISSEQLKYFSTAQQFTTFSWMPSSWCTIFADHKRSSPEG